MIEIEVVKMDTFCGSCQACDRSTLGEGTLLYPYDEVNILSFRKRMVTMSIRLCADCLHQLKGKLI